jgi:CheY-like chemotaxis protein
MCDAELMKFPARVAVAPIGKCRRWEAFEPLSGKLPDVIVTDWKMPRIDILGFCLNGAED